MLERSTELLFKSEDLWQAVKNGWPDLSIRNESNITNPNLDVCLIFCPLYSQVSLANSKLIHFPQNILDSRVSRKLEAYLTVVGSLNTRVQLFNGSINLKTFIADKGVLFEGEYSQVDIEALQYHKDLYNQALGTFCEPRNIKYDIKNYDEAKVDFPMFVDPNSPIPEDLLATQIEESNERIKMINLLNIYMHQLEIPHQIENTKKARDIIKGVLSMNGINFDGAFWIIAGYLAFDHKIKDIIGDNGIYLSCERFDALFSIAKLTPSLDKLTRIQIKA